MSEENKDQQSQGVELASAKFSEESQEANGEGDRDADFSQLEEGSGEIGADDVAEGDGEEGDSSDGELRKEVVTLRQQVKSLSVEVDENKQKYLRALADLENFKKRTQKERSNMLKYEGERILFDILEVIDNLDLALQHADSEPENLKSGLELIHKRFVDILSKWGIRGESEVGKVFDPNRHHAISRLQVEDAEPGTIIDELKKVYFYKDKLLRAAEVVVCEGQKKSANEVAQSDGEASEEEGVASE